MLLGLLIGGCDLPRDPEDTLTRVTNGTMRVGISENTPWVRIVDAEPSGVEVALIREWATGLGARIDWVQGTESELLAALEKRELDLVIAGLTRDSPWSNRVGLSQTYITTRILIGAPAGTDVPPDWSGRTVAYDAEQPILAAFLKRQDATPVATTEAVPKGPVAAADWQLAAWGFQPASDVLHEKKHAIAVALGENRFLLRLEQFLLPREAQVGEMLAEAAR